MESIDSKHKKMNTNLFDMYTFKTNNPYIECSINIPIDTNNKSSNEFNFDTCKCSARNYNILNEEKLRQKYAKINSEDSVLKIKEKINNIQKMDNEFKTYSNINKNFQNKLIETDEKLIFNNHTRLF